MAFRTSNNMHKFLSEKHHLPSKNLSGVYRLKCDNCPAFCIGQTGREFHVIYKEHLPKIKATSEQKSNISSQTTTII